MERMECSALFLDVRNFTKQLSDDKKKIDFINIIQEVYLCGLKTCESIVKKEQFYINSTGDGFLIVVFSEKHYLEAFLLALLLHIRVTDLFKKHKWQNLEEGAYYFGIGLESGYVYKVVAQNNEGKKIETYLGDVINIASRLEALSKEHARAPIIYGLELNQFLVSKLCNKNYKELMEKAKNNACNSEEYHREMNEINSKLLSSYLFENRLKGVEKPMPVFRISPTLFLSEQKAVDNFIELLPQEYETLITDIIPAQKFEKNE